MPAAVIYAANYLAVSGAISVGTAVAIGSFAATYGTAMLLVGSLALAQDQARKAKQQAKDQYNAAQVDRLANISSAIAPRELVLGRVRKAGSVFYRASTGSLSSHMYVAIALAGHEIDGVEQIYLNDQPVTLDGGGHVQNAPYATYNRVSKTATADAEGKVYLPSNYVSGTAWSDVDGSLTATGLVVQTQPGSLVSYQVSEFASVVQIAIHLGEPGQVVDPWLREAFAAAWGDDDVAQGVAYVVMRCSYTETAFPSGLPSLSAVVRGAKVLDPRTSLTAWSENPALLMRHVYQHPNFGKATVTAEEDARFIAAANACDTSTVYMVDGVAQPARPLFTAATVHPYGTAGRSVLDDLSQAMGGSSAFAGGQFYLKPGTYSAPVMSLGEADLAVVVRDGTSSSQNPIKISVHKERASKFNTVKATIWDAGQDYKQTALTPLTSTALKARDGAELVQEISYSAISYAPQAQHVAGIMMRDARDPLVVELTFKLGAYPLELFDVVTLTLARYGWVNKQFMVLSRTLTGQGTVALTLKETSAAITTMDADFLPQGYAANTNLPKPWEVADVGALLASSGTTELLAQADGTVVSRVRITWPTPADQAVIQSGQVEVQYRASDSTGAWSSVTVAGNETQAIISDVQDGKSYVIRARFKTTLAVGDWSEQIGHVVIGKTEPPPPFDLFTVMAQPDGTRQFNFGYSGIKPLDWLGAEIRYTAGTVPAPDWDAMTRLQDTDTHYTSSPVELNAPLPGAWTFAIRSVDTSGNKSSMVVRSITLPDRRLGNVLDEYFEHTEGFAGVKTNCHLQEGVLEANDSTTWATLPSTWAAWTRWNFAPAATITYETPARDLGVAVSGLINVAIVADGTASVELATSANGTAWSAWGSASAAFAARWVKLRLTVAATGPAPVPLVRSFGWQVNAPIRSEYVNDVVTSSLTGAYRIGVGDVRIPLSGTYSVIKRTSVVIQDNSAGTWTSTRIDQSLSPAPRWQFRLNGALADPQFVDFFIEGF